MSTAKKSNLMAILFDNTRCIGCRSCEEACDDENSSRKRKWEAGKGSEMRFRGAGGPPAM